MNPNSPIQAKLNGKKIGEYIAPNEQYPQQAIEVFESAPSGAYVSVGTERGFMGAAMSPKVTHLVLLDRDPGVNTYNRINVLLLKMAKDRTDYLKLRLNPTEARWRERAQQAQLDSHDVDFLLKHVRDWYLSVAVSKEFDDFQTEAKSEKSKFGSANYLFNDQLFERIHQMAKAGNIAVGEIAITDSAALDSYVISKLKAKNIPLSVLDISNAWWFMYTKFSVSKTLKAFNPIANDTSILLTTTGSISPRAYVRVITNALAKKLDTGWVYRAYTFKLLRSYPSFEAFRRQLTWADFTNVSDKTKIDPILLKPLSIQSLKRCVGWVENLVTPPPAIR